MNNDAMKWTGLREAEGASLAPDAVNRVLRAADEAPISSPQRIGELVRRPRVRLLSLLEAAGRSGEDLSDEVVLSVETDLKYVGYIERERAAARRMGELMAFQLAPDLPFKSFLSLSTEARQKLERVRPTTLAQASRIPGISPSDLQNLVTEVVKLRRSAA